MSYYYVNEVMNNKRLIDYASSNTNYNYIVRWKAFLKKIQWKETLDFKTVMEVIKERLQPMAEKYWKK